jgi:hypothetical protein
MAAGGGEMNFYQHRRQSTATMATVYCGMRGRQLGMVGGEVRVKVRFFPSCSCQERLRQSWQWGESNATEYVESRFWFLLDEASVAGK